MRNRRLIWILALLAVAIGDLLVVAWRSGGFRPTPRILATLPGSWSDAEFKRQVTTTFPVGSSEDTMIATLASQGFRPDWRRRDGENSASYTESGLLCRREAKVMWRSDTQGGLASVDGFYRETCDGM
jgi:hypothetical protein